MLPEGRFAVVLATIGSVFLVVLISLFSFLIFNTSGGMLEGFNIFEASGSGKQFTGLKSSFK